MDVLGRLKPPFLFRRLMSGKVSAFTPEKPGSIRTLLKPIGQETPAVRGENSGNEARSWEEIKTSMMDSKRNRRIREELKKELAKSSYSSIYQFRDTGGKFFRSAPALFAAEEALYMPNFCGQDLSGQKTTLVDLIAQQVCLVRIFTTMVAEKQTSTFLDNINLTESNLRLVDVNVPTNWLNEKLLKWNAGRIRRSLKNDHHYYMISRRGVTPEVRRLIWAENVLGGYLYVVDKQGKIRWAASGTASANELSTLHSIISTDDLG